MDAVKLKEVKDFILQWTEENKEKFYAAEHYIWEHPELSMQEYDSSNALKELMEGYGFQVEMGVAHMPTAFIATFGSGKPVIGINAEYDALPGLSQDPEKLVKTPVTPGAPGHGCGHNLLGVGGAKAACALKAAMEKFNLPGTVKLLGTPGEELCLGKPIMGKYGCLEGFDAILDWHPWNYSKGDYDACQAYFNVRYHFSGATCHGNSPWHGRSALDGAMLMGHATEILREHVYPGNPPDAANTFNYTFVTTGPEFASVVPDYTTIWYIGRFGTTEEMLDVLKRVDKCAEGAAIATETTVRKELITATHHKIPNKTLCQAMHNNFQMVGPPQFTEEEQAKAKAIQKEIGVAETGLPMEIQPFKGGWTVLCDTSEYSWNAPYASPWIGMAMEGCGWHHWGVARCGIDTMGEKSMDKAAEVIALTGADVLLDPELVSAAHDEWLERLDGKTYKCLLPEDYEVPIHLNEDVMSKYR